MTQDSQDIRKHPLGGWCRHYIMPAEVCKAGIAYPKPGPRPCYEGSSICGECPSFASLTPEEWAEQKRQSDEALAKYLRALDTNVCPHCGVAVEKRVQIGRCACAKPCGHRLYQGRA
jgi:hypothetical protein